MKIYKVLAVTAIALPLILTGCDVDKTQEGKMPDVDVEVSGGQMPEYEVEGPDVTVGTETKMVEVTVPTVDVDLPEEEDNAMGEPATEPAREPKE